MNISEYGCTVVFTIFTGYTVCGLYSMWLNPIEKHLTASSKTPDVQNILSLT